MTETLDVRLTARQLDLARNAIAARMAELERRLRRSSYAGKPGMLDRVLDEQSELRELYADLGHNLQQINRQS